MIKAHPWFGVGPEMVLRNFTLYVPENIPRPLPEGYYAHLHNIYIHYAAERGIPAMLILMWVLGRALYDFIRGLHRVKSPVARALLEGCIAVIIGVLIEGMFEVNLGDSEVLAIFLAAVASGYVALRQEAQVV
jgi:O-antigen ligase